MKKIILLITVIFIIFSLVCCSNASTVNVTYLTPSQVGTEVTRTDAIVSPTTETSVSPSTAPSVSSSPEQSLLPSPTPFVTGTPEDEWYEWDTAGAPPMSALQVYTGCHGVIIASDGESIYYPVFDENEKMVTLYKSLMDGTNKIKLDEYVEENKNFNGAPTCYVNYCNGWVYYSFSTSLYRIRPDGTERTLIIQGEDTPVCPISFIIVGDEIYLYDNSIGGYKCDLKGNITPIDGPLCLIGYDSGNVCYICTDGGDDAPDLLGVYNIQTRQFKDLPKTEGFEPYVVYKGILYSISENDKIICYNIETGSKKTINCNGMGIGGDIGVYEDSLVIYAGMKTKTIYKKAIYEYNLDNGSLSKLCECPSNVNNICTTRDGIYLYDGSGDNIYWLKDNNGQYSVVPISDN